jgi:DNA-binding LytR/AlgR family response regulator
MEFFMSKTALRIAIVEDNYDCAARLFGFVKSADAACKLSVFNSGADFLKTFYSGKYDLIFLDIYMEGPDGIKTAESIRETDSDAVIAFATSSPEHTRAGFRVKALKYLDKPVTAGDVEETLELALTMKTKKKSRPFITVTLSGGNVSDVPTDGIMYLEIKNNVVEIHTSSGILTTSHSARLGKFEKLLPSPPFLRCHRSYIVNLDYVLNPDKEINAFIMKNGSRTDIRRGGFAECKSCFENRILDKTGRDEV